MSDFEIIIQPDGNVLLNSGEPEHNKIMLSIAEILCSEKQKDDIVSFFDFADTTEPIYGPGNLCG